MIRNQNNGSRVIFVRIFFSNFFISPFSARYDWPRSTHPVNVGGGPVERPEASRCSIGKCSRCVTGARTCSETGCYGRGVSARLVQQPDETRRRDPTGRAPCIRPASDAPRPSVIRTRPSPSSSAGTVKRSRTPGPACSVRRARWSSPPNGRTSITSSFSTLTTGTTSTPRGWRQTSGNYRTSCTPTDSRTRQKWILIIPRYAGPCF